MYPMKLTPPCKDYLWGGSKLRTQFHKQSDKKIIAESWELSCHKDGPSVIANGEYAGKTLQEYINEAGKEALGAHGAAFDEFPVLIKLIDARDNLSVQVHPDNDYALKAEGEYGKTEMWYIVDCDEGASLIYGFDHEITKEEFKARIENNTLLEAVNTVPVKKGDVFFISAGTLHAIGKGIVIAEIQQNSNTTYRVYDFGRVGADGKPRALHIDKALDVTKLTRPERGAEPQGGREQHNGYASTLLSSCEYFTVSRLEVQDAATLTAGGESFHALLCLEGGAALSSLHGDIELQKGDCVFLPANFGEYRVKGACELLLTTV